jgi:hypothetical protein
VIRLQGDPNNPGDLAATALKNRLIDTLLASPEADDADCALSALAHVLLLVAEKAGVPSGVVIMTLAQMAGVPVDVVPPDPTQKPHPC